MPTYQYACTSESCGLNFERVQSFTDAAITECPDCSAQVRKVYGSVGVVFKGSGFYRTDSRDTKSGAKAKSETGGGSADSGSSSGSSSSSSSTSSAGSNAGASKTGGSETKPKAAAAS